MLFLVLSFAAVSAENLGERGWSRPCLVRGATELERGSWFSWPLVQVGGFRANSDPDLPGTTGRASVNTDIPYQLSEGVAFC